MFDGPGAPYFLRFPLSGETPSTDLVLFLSSSSMQMWAENTYQWWLEDGDGIEEVLILVPFGHDGGIANPVEALDHVESCYCTSKRTHIGGEHQGGDRAYDLFLATPERFTTLVAAPGSPDQLDAATVTGAFAGKAAFHAVGDEDTNHWHDQALEAHEFLLDQGIDSQFITFPSFGSFPTNLWDETVLYEFWATH